VDLGGLLKQAYCSYLNLVLHLFDRYIRAMIAAQILIRLFSKRRRIYAAAWFIISQW
jgi:hypothetical protein